MASSNQAPLRRSYDGLHADDDDETGLMYACDCGQEFRNDQELRRHQQSNCQNRSVTLKCSFCEETCPSSAKLREHLLLCGNKTDQCPNCHQLIRRSHFAYHYENNCAPIDRVETPPPPRPKNRSVLHPVTNSNKPYLREDVPSDNYHDQNGRIHSPKSTPRSSPGIIECEFCHNRCAQNDYKTHRDNCLRNPTNTNYRSPISLRSNQNQNQNQNQKNPNGIVHVPCEICNEPIDLPNWSQHTQNCREREKQRIAMRARSMSQEPVTEKLPCEHCQQLYSAKQLQAHQIKCPYNPENVDPRTKRTPSRPSKSASLPTRSKNDRSHPTSTGGRFRQDIRDVQYEKIDLDRTREANRSLDRDRPINQRNANQNPIRRLGNNDIVSRSDDRLDIQTYDNEPIRPNRSRPPNGILPRERSSFDNLRNIQDTQNPNGRAARNRSPYPNDHRGSQRLRQGSSTLEVINNDGNRPLVKKHKKQSFLKSLFCGAPPPVYD